MIYPCKTSIQIKFLSDRVIILFSNSYNRLSQLLIIPIVIQYIIILIGAEEGRNGSGMGAAHNMITVLSYLRHAILH